MLLSLVAVLAIKYWHRTLPAEECGEIYCRYAGRDDLKVSFLKDFRIDDSTVVDVTTLTAKDSASWESLLREMNVSEITIEYLRKSYSKRHPSLSNYYCKKGQPYTRTSANDDSVDLVVYVQHLNDDKTFFIFDIKSIEQAHIIMNHKTDEMP